MTETSLWDSDESTLFKDRLSSCVNLHHFGLSGSTIYPNGKNEATTDVEAREWLLGVLAHVPSSRLRHLSLDIETAAESDPIFTTRALQVAVTRFPRLKSLALLGMDSGAVADLQADYAMLQFEPMPVCAECGDGDKGVKA